MVNPAEFRAQAKVHERNAVSAEEQRRLDISKQDFRGAVDEYVQLTRDESYRDLELYSWDDQLFAGREVGHGPGGPRLIIMFEEDSHQVVQGVGQCYINEVVNEQGNTINVLMSPVVDETVIDTRSDADKAATPGARRDNMPVQEWQTFDLDTVETDGTMMLSINTALIKRWSDTIKASRL